MHFRLWSCTLLLATLGILIACSPECVAQNPGSLRSTHLKHIHFNAEWYQPSLDFWDQNQFIRSWSDQPGGSVSVSAGATFDVGLPVEPSFSVGYWRDQAGQSDVARIDGIGDERFTVTMIPLAASVSYPVEALKQWEVTPLVEAGGSLRWLQQGYEFEPTTGGASPVDQSDSGWATTARLSLGARRPVAGQLAQLNVGYVFGSYRMLVPVSDGTDREQAVSLSGPQIGLTVFLGL